MLVHFKFYRCGYFAEGLVEKDNLDDAAEALWKEHPKTFKWTDIQGPDNENRLTLENGMSKALLDKLSQKRNLEAQWASEFIANGSVTVKMVELGKKIGQLAQELKEDSEVKA